MSAAATGSPEQRTSGLRLAVVGAGPRGVFALERLWHHLRLAADAEPVTIDMFDPGAVAGPGPVYDPSQPAFLRMNFAADRIGLWPSGSVAIPAARQSDFPEWNEDRDPGGEAAAEAYPPRALVGRYLADGFALLRDHAPDAVTLSMRRERVKEVHRLGAGWRVQSGVRCHGTYDEVLLTTGHGTPRGDGPPVYRGDGAVWVGSVFPVGALLRRGCVRAGATVAVRGFGLSFIDAALALTEGRGGTFERCGDDDRLRYVGSVDEVGRILPFSRTGRPALAKPDPHLAGAIAGVAELGAAAREQLRALDGPLSLERGVVPALAGCAARHLLAARARPHRSQDVDRATIAAASWLRAACNGRALAGADTALAEIAESVAVGAGRRAPGLLWALGQTWRSIYPAVVERLGATGIRDCDQAPFRRLQAEMERIAFGPPVLNAAKLLALVASGHVDLRSVAGGELATRSGATWIERGGLRERADVVVDAVLAGAGLQSDGAGVVARLVADGHAELAPGRRGIRVAADGSCVRADGRRSEGLAAIGRCTEDWVIGNDTLDRTLHPHLDRWARRIVGRLACAAAAPALAGGLR